MISRIISGGQTGVDRGALDAAQGAGIETGGWCPRGRRAEDGRIPPRYALEETESDDYADRTEANVLEADATLVLTASAASPGTALTIECCRRHGRPFLLWPLTPEHPAPGVGLGPASGSPDGRDGRRPPVGDATARSKADPTSELERIRAFLVDHGVRTLNVAGPRESECPGIGSRAFERMEALLGSLQREETA